MFKRKGGGVKGLLNNVKKTALFSRDGFPNCICLQEETDLELSMGMSKDYEEAIKMVSKFNSCVVLNLKFKNVQTKTSSLFCSRS